MRKSVTTRVAGETKQAYRTRAYAKVIELHEQALVDEEITCMDGVRLIGPNLDAYINMRDAN